MNRLLAIDKDMFEKEYPEATNFFIRAHLRYEAFTIMCRPFSKLNQWEKDRLVELFNTPACQTQWFMKEREHWFKKNLTDGNCINEKYA